MTTRPPRTASSEKDKVPAQRESPPPSPRAPETTDMPPWSPGIAVGPNPDPYGPFADLANTVGGKPASPAKE